jgi:hypothetical protein
MALSSWDGEPEERAQAYNALGYAYFQQEKYEKVRLYTASPKAHVLFFVLDNNGSQDGGGGGSLLLPSHRLCQYATWHW